jgi:hypothetical protein
MMRAIGVLATAAIAIGCSSNRGPQHAAILKCSSADAESANKKDETNYGPTWCAVSLDRFLAEHPDVELDNFSVFNEVVGEGSFASIVLLYRGDVKLKGGSN